MGSVKMDTKELAKIMKALSNQNRLELYLKIVKESQSNFETGCECFISDIKEKLKIGAPTISRHLKELANADLIVTERRVKFLVAQPNESVLKEVANFLSIEVIFFLPE